WRKDPNFDALMSERFGTLHARGCQCELFRWREAPLGRLAEIIVLDQFSRNMYRGTKRAFVADPLALALAQEAIALNLDEQLSQLERSMLYMPFMHSESLAIHEIAVDLFRKNGIASNYEYELKHKAVIEQFGRYPHRNIILGRQSSPQELEFLKQPGSRF
ncbi:MAG: DUF924 family protein, partial [Cyanobacteria bacterium P01_G01_bin.4]